MNKSHLIFLLAFGITYVFLAVVMWLGFGTYDGIFSVKRTMHRFATTYARDLQEGVFEKVYAQAKKCQSLRAPAAKQICETQSGLQISRLLKEEELADENGYNWPNDLFFVKKTGETYERIGWDGKLTDISGNIHHTPIPNAQTSLNLLLWQNCSSFGSLISPDAACEVYETVPLANNAVGYMVRLYPSVEENMLVLYFFHPLLALMYLKDFTYIGAFEIPYMLSSFLSMLVCFALAIKAKRWYLKRQTVQTKKKVREH